MLESLSVELSKAGIYISDVRIYSVEGKEIYDIIIDKPLSEFVFDKIYRELQKYNVIPMQLRATGFYVIRVIPIKKGERRWLRLLLTVLTFITVWMTGYGLTYSLYELTDRIAEEGEVLIWSTLYALIFMAALAIHELGHLYIARKYHVPATGPYFIPAPPIQLGFLGTLGAVISMKGLPPNRRVLGLLGIMGPLWGFAAGFLIGIIGEQLSPLIPLAKAQELIESGEAAPLPFMPLIMILISYTRTIPPGYTTILHPLSFIAFVVFIITFINLMPIGQLDGGHVIRTFTSARVHELIGILTIMFFVITGTLFIVMGYGVTIYFTLAIVLTIFKFLFGSRPHPGPANSLSRIKVADYIILATYIALLVLTMPVPLI